VKVGVLPLDQGRPHQHSKIPPSETLTKIEGLKTGSRVCCAMSRVGSKALVQVFVIGFVSEGFGVQLGFGEPV
jgi:hypothetical protein